MQRLILKKTAAFNYYIIYGREKVKAPQHGKSATINSEMC